MTKSSIALCCAAIAALVTGADAQVDHSNRPVRPGSWSYAPTGTGSEAIFSDANRQTLLIIRCTRSTRRLAISLRTVPASAMLLWTSSASRSLPAGYNPASGFLTAELAAGDNLLDGVAFSRGRFSVTVQGAAFVVPAWAEPARAIEDCRN